MVGGRYLESSSSSSRGGLISFGRKKSSAAAAATCALPAPPSSSCPDAVVAEQLHQFDMRLKQLEESQIVTRQPRPLPPPPASPPSSSPPPPPPTPPAAPVAAKAKVNTRTQSCFSAELRRAAEAAAATFARRQQRQPEQRPLERQVPPRGQIGNSDQLQQQQQKSSSSSSSSMASIARLREANLRSSLMERLRLLENRIFQLSFELDQERNSGGSSSSRGSSSTTFTTATTRTRQTTTTSSSSDKEWPLQSMAPSSTVGADGAAPVEMAIVPAVSSSSQSRFTLGGRLQGHTMSKMKKPMTKDSKQVAAALDGPAGNYCKKEKRRMERTRIYKKWFPLIGC